MPITTETADVARTIYSQIPFWSKARLGVHKPQVIEDGLRLKVGRARLTFIEITLDVMDTYTVKVIKMKKQERVEIYKAENVYNDMLGDIFDAADKAIWPR